MLDGRQRPCTCCTLTPAVVSSQYSLKETSLSPSGLGLDSCSRPLPPPPPSGLGLVAVGSEDSGIYLLAVGGKPYSCAPQPLAVLWGHTSSVRALSGSASCLEGGDRLLFSGGGRAELKVWRLGGRPVLSQWCVCGSAFSLAVLGGVAGKRLATSLEAEMHLFNGFSGHWKKWRGKKPRNFSDGAYLPECRVMALASFLIPRTLCHDMESGLCYVAAGCSDGLIR